MEATCKRSYNTNNNNGVLLREMLNAILDSRDYLGENILNYSQKRVPTLVKAWLGNDTSHRIH